MFAIPLLILAAVFLLLVAVRRAVPLVCAGLVGWLVWTLTRDIGAALSSGFAAMLIACWLLDVATQGRGMSRRIAIALELVAGASLAAFFAFVLTNSAGDPSPWVIGSAAVAALAVVANWRSLAC